MERVGPPGTRPARGPLACVNEDPLNVQSTGLVLGPDGRIVVRVYSSGAIGRLVPEDVIGVIDYEREHAR
jgi:hypothetical protein